MKRIMKYVGWIVAQSAFALLLATFFIGPAIRGEHFFWQRHAAPEKQLDSDEETSDEPNSQADKKEKKRSRELGTLLPIESVIVNVAQTQGRRFLKASLTLELEAKQTSEVHARVPIMRGAVIDVLASKNLDELVAPNAREVIRSEILETLATKNENMKFKDLFFTEFIVQ